MSTAILVVSCCPMTISAQYALFDPWLLSTVALRLAYGAPPGSMAHTHQFLLHTFVTLQAVFQRLGTNSRSPSAVSH